MVFCCYLFQNSINVSYLYHTGAYCCPLPSPMLFSGGQRLHAPRPAWLGWPAWRISRGQQGTLQKRREERTPPKCSSAPPGCGRVGQARWPGAATVAPCSQQRRRRRARKIRVTLRLDLLPFIRHHHQTLCCPRCSSAGPSEQLRPLHTVGFSQFFRPTWLR